MNIKKCLTDNISIEERPTNRLAIIVEMSHRTAKKIALAVGSLVTWGSVYASIAPFDTSKTAAVDATVAAGIFLWGMYTVLKPQAKLKP